MVNIKFFVWRKSIKDTVIGVFDTYADAFECFHKEESKRIKAVEARDKMYRNFREGFTLPPDIERINVDGYLTIIMVELDNGYILTESDTGLKDKSFNHIVINQIEVKIVNEDNRLPAWTSIQMIH